jgi:hypothetical protein
MQFQKTDRTIVINRCKGLRATGDPLSLCFAGVEHSFGLQNSFV